MTIQEFFELTKKTRAAQKLYYLSRLQGDLIAAKQLERELDKAIEAGLDFVTVQRPNEPEQKTLFTEDGNEDQDQ